MEARLAKIRAKERSQRDKYLKGDQAFKKRKMESKHDNDDAAAAEEQYILDDYESDNEKSSNNGGASSIFSAATIELMNKVGMGPIASRDEGEEEEDEIKVSSGESRGPQ